jgi:hypothetical protein
MNGCIGMEDRAGTSELVEREQVAELVRVPKMVGRSASRDGGQECRRTREDGRAIRCGGPSFGREAGVERASGAQNTQRR